MPIIVASFALVLMFIILYILMIKVYSVLFRMTGLSPAKARFQTISLLTNAGFTTAESEVIASDKRRRKIASACMITGNAFSVIIVSLALNLIMSFLNSNISAEELQRSIFILVYIFLGFLFLLVFQSLPFIRRGTEKLIERIATRALGGQSRNVLTLLDNYGREAIVEVKMNVVPEALEGKTLAESHIRDRYKINVMVIHRKDKVIDATADSLFQKGDILVTFGRYQNIKDLFEKVEYDADELLEDNSLINAVELINNYGKEATAEVSVNIVPARYKDIPMRENGLKEKDGINVLLIRRGGDIIKPDANTIIEKGDILSVFGNYKKIKEVFLENLD